MTLRHRIARMMSSGNPLAQVVGLVLMALLLTGALIVGAVAGVLLVGVALVGVATVAARLWWLRRRIRRNGTVDGAGPARADANPRGGNVIDAEFRVIEDGRKEDR